MYFSLLLLVSEIPFFVNRLKFSEFVLLHLQLEEDLQKARCVLTDGDAASFLPNKSQGGLFCLSL